VYLNVRACGFDGLGQVRVLLLEVLLEHHRQVVRGLVEARGALPVLARHQDAVGHTVARSGNVDIKDVVVHELAVLDGAVEGAGHQGARVGKLDAMTHAVAAADPAGVDQVHTRAAVGNALAEHLGVNHGVEWHKRLAEQRRERGRRLGDADLGAGDLGRKARHKVIHGGIGR